MKLAWIGNLHNVGFHNVRLLNTAGQPADLFLPKVLLGRQDVSNPEHEYRGAGGEPFLKPFYRDYLNYALNRVGVPGPVNSYERAIGRRYDLVQAQTCYEISAMRINRRFGIPYCALATGADLSEIAPADTPFARLYRRALAGCSHLFLTNIDQFATLDRLALGLRSVSFLPFSINSEKFAPRRNEAGEEIIIYSVARLDWTSRDRASTKQNDLFFRGFARCVRERRAGNFRLWIADWGVDREATRRLVAELGIEPQVDFIPPGDKAAFYANLEKANVVVDQFKLGAVGLAALESMAMSRPVFARCDRELSRRAYGSEIPVLNCASEDDVVAALEGLNPESVARLAGESFAWVSEYHSDTRIAGLLGQKYSEILAGRSPA